MVVMLIDAVFQSPVASVWWPWDRSGGLVDYEEIAAVAEPPNMADSGGLDGYGLIFSASTGARNVTMRR